MTEQTMTTPQKNVIKKLHRPRIVFVTTTPITLELFVRDTAVMLSNELGYEVYLASNPQHDFEESLPRQLRYIRIPMRRGISVTNGVAASLKLTRRFKHLKPECVQYSTPNAALYASLGAFFTRVPIRVYAQWGIRYVGYRGLKRWALKQIEKLVCRISTHIRPVSPGNLAFGIAEGLYSAEKASVVGKGGTIGVNLSEYPSEMREEMGGALRTQMNISSKFIFGYVGRLARDKGINELISAFRDLLETTENEAVLMIIGPREVPSEIDASLLEWANASESVVFTGPQPHSNLARYFAAIDCLVVPSYREGFSMVIQEAGAMGCAVITTDIPGASEVLEEGASCILVEPRESRALMVAMSSLLLDPERCSRMGQAARAYVEQHFNRDDMLIRLKEDYRLLMEGIASE